MDSVFVLNSASVLFRTTGSPEGEMAIRGLNSRTDRNGDGQLRITDEIEPALRQEAKRLLDLARDGLLGRYWQSLMESPAPGAGIHLVQAPILFVHGALDVQSPLDEPLAMMARLEALDRRDYDMLFFPNLGHSLAKPNDFYKGDGGLSVLDNLTFDTPKPKTRRQILRRIEALLAR